MKMRRVLAGLVTAVMSGAMALAQDGPPSGLSWQVDGFAQWQGSTDLDGGGSFSVNRGVLRGQALHTVPGGAAVGLQVSLGRYDYRFRNTGTQPWEDITDLRLSLPVLVPVGQRARAIIVPSLRYDYESGASSNGQTWGVFAGISWQVSDRLRIGPAFGAYTRLEDDDLEIFPALLIDWEISDRWSLSTGSGLGATQGPGLTLRYAVNDALSLSLIGRSESIRFRLNDRGPAPGGVGEDSSLPVVLALNYEPHPGLSLSAFAGAELNGVLRLDDAAGQTIRQEAYDTAPVAGLALRLRF